MILHRVARLCRILANEPESWLSYFAGQKSHMLMRRKSMRVRSRMLAFPFGQLLITFRSAVRFTAATGSSAADHPYEMLAFAGTANQLESLEATVKELRLLGTSILAIAQVDKLVGDDRRCEWSPMRWPIVVTFVGFTAFLKRRRELKHQLDAISTKLYAEHLHPFSIIYFWLAYFDFLLERVRPKFVLMSNDHSVANRCLLAVAREQGVDTVYLQHASVSSIFPALDFRYAFLDGRVAFETYLSCERNRVSFAVRPDRRDVFLSGNKKTVSSASVGNAVGVAVNMRDSVTAVRDACEVLVGCGFPVRVRPHPRTSRTGMTELIEALNSIEGVQLVPPAAESLKEFVGQLFCLVAANTSTHLEAAIAGVVTLYFEFGESGFTDYYGYVSGNLSTAVPDLQSLAEATQAAHRGDLRVNADAVRQFSETFGTQWEGREGVLVANHLIWLAAGGEPAQLWGHTSFKEPGSSSLPQVGSYAPEAEGPLAR